MLYNFSALPLGVCVRSWPNGIVSKNKIISKLSLLFFIMTIFKIGSILILAVDSESFG